MLEIGDKVMSVLNNRVGTVIERYEMGWYRFRWIDGEVTRGQISFYRRITEEEFVAQHLMRSVPR